MTTPLTDEQLLRVFLGERVPTGGTDADTFFSDDEIATLLATSQYGVEGAAVIGWAAKAGEFARLIDINESGGQRTLSQKFRQANTQLAYYQSLVNQKVAVATTSGRVPGKPINWADECRKPGLVLYRTRYNRMPLFS
jgi:hypothetical protein